MFQAKHAITFISDPQAVQSHCSLSGNRGETEAHRNEGRCVRQPRGPRTQPRKSLGPRVRRRGLGGPADKPAPSGTPPAACLQTQGWRTATERGDGSGARPEAAFAEQAQVLMPSPQQIHQLQPLRAGPGVPGDVVGRVRCGECDHSIKTGTTRVPLFLFYVKPKKPVSLYELTTCTLNAGWLPVLRKIVEKAMGEPRGCWEAPCRDRPPGGARSPTRALAHLRLVPLIEGRPPTHHLPSETRVHLARPRLLPRPLLLGLLNSSQGGSSKPRP